MIRFGCSCGKQLQVRDEMAGKRVACPGCKKVMVVPAAAAPPPPPELEEVESVTEQPRPSRAGARPRPRVARNEEEMEEGGSSPVKSETSGKAIASLVLGLVSILCMAFTGLPAMLMGLLALLDIKKQEGRLSGKGLAFTGLLLGAFWSIACVGGSAYFYFRVKSAATEFNEQIKQKAEEFKTQVEEGVDQGKITNDLMQIGIACQSYSSSTKRFPAAAICDPTGKPLLSWRVALLPRLGQQDLYKKFRLKEPWDSPHNKRLLAQIPDVYRLPDRFKIPPGETVYQVFVGDDAVFDESKGHTVAEITDGLSNTLLVAEASRSVPWTKPEDIAFNPDGPLPALGGHLKNKAVIGLADGSSKVIKLPIADDQLKALITRNGGELINWPGLQ